MTKPKPLTVACMGAHWISAWLVNESDSFDSVRISTHLSRSEAMTGSAPLLADSLMDRSALIQCARALLDLSLGLPATGNDDASDLLDALSGVKRSNTTTRARRVRKHLPMFAQMRRVIECSNEENLRNLALVMQLIEVEGGLPFDLRCVAIPAEDMKSGVGSKH